MNKAVTDGILFMPPAFSGGLGVWSSQDGTPGSDTYASTANAAFVPADQDFGGCLELQKTTSVQKLRYMGETPLLPGCYLRVTARVKAISGVLPSVRIAAWAGGAGGAHVTGVVETGPSMALTSYGQVVEISAIIGTGQRQGVDLSWGTSAIYGHFGIDLTGANGGVVRIDDIVIEDATADFLRDMMNWVDVRDYGATGDGVTDDSAAFMAADAAADGRRVLVSKGVYHLAQNVSLNSRVEFEGTVTMPDDRVLQLARDFDLPTYVDAFGDEVLAFKKAFQALITGGDHESLDMGGRRIQVHGPIDMQAAVANRVEFAQRRVIRNGQFYVESSSDWDDTFATSQATYSSAQPWRLSNVTNVANIAVGSLVTGGGVGREVYVRERNIAAQTITLSRPLYDAVGTQVFTFTRFKYLLDFSGFEKLSKFQIEDIEFNMNARCSAILLPPEGLTFHIKDCVLNGPKDRAITSHGEGCQGMLIDRNQFLSSQIGMRAQDRTSIAINTNAHDVKIRDNRITQFRHFAVLGGTSSIVTGNHWFQGDTEADGIRMGGLVLTQSNCRASIVGNYIDNCFVEWTNEHDVDPDYQNGFSFSGLSIANCVFQAGNVAPWFRFIVIKPFGTGHFINGLFVTGNTFRIIGANVERVDQVDTSFAPLNNTRMRDVEFKGNSFNSINVATENPVSIEHEQNTAASTWTVDCAPRLPFGGWARNIEAVVARRRIRLTSNATIYSFPNTGVEKGTNRDQVELEWGQAVTGKVMVTVRVDN